MKYVRPTNVRKSISKEFEVGNHKAMIKKVTRLPGDNKKKKDTFMFHLEGVHGESIVSFLTFETPFTKENLQYLLASIEDNGVIIPNISFRYNRETYEFLFGKNVFINVAEGRYKGKKQNQVTGFITLKEYQQESF